MSGFLVEFDVEYAPRLAHRARTFRRTFELLLAAERDGYFVVETGCARQAGNWSGDGQSTLLFDRFVSLHGGEVLSFDSDRAACEAARGQVSERTRIEQVDAIRGLEQLPPGRPIDLLYLDSLDVDWDDPHPSSLHHLKELCAALPKLAPGTLVVVDDDPEGRGKGQLIRELMDRAGVRPVFDEYQVGWIVPARIGELARQAQALLEEAGGRQTIGSQQPPSPRVSIVLATHDRAALLPRAARSVLAQTWRDLELVVVDDASRDSTPSVLAELAQEDPRVRVVRREVSQAEGNPDNPRNAGLALAHGEYLGFLDDDDRYRPEFVARMLAFLEARPWLGLAYCDTVFHRQEQGREVATVNRSVDFDLALLRRVSYVSTTEILVRRSVALAVGGWRHHVKHGPSDQGFVLAVAERAGVAHLREVLGDNYWSNDWPCERSADHALLDPPERAWGYEPGCEHPATWRPPGVDLESWSRSCGAS